MNVKESPGERLVYLVQSSTKAERWYRCDLLFNHGYGMCACIDWSTRRWPAVKRGSPPGTREVLCRHLIAARRYFTNALLRELATTEERAS